MNLTQWVEMSSVIGHLDGMATIMEVTEDIEPKKIKDSIMKIRDRLLVLHKELGPEVIENEKKTGKEQVKNKSTVNMSKSKKEVEK